MANWPTAITVTALTNATVVAVKILDYGGFAGFLGSFSDGSVTDSSWKCTTTAVSNNWTLPTFDNSAWPFAVATLINGDGPWGILTEIASNAKWIWSGSYVTGDAGATAYCRKML